MEHRMKPSRLVVLVAVLAALVPADAFAQAGRRVEVGGQASLLNLSRSDSTSAGIGGRVSFDLTRWIAAEAEMTFFPNDDIIVRSAIPGVHLDIGHFRRRTDGFFGVKVGARGRRYGVFAKARPGFTRLTNQGTSCIGEDCARVLMLFLPDRYRTEFAFDLGGGLEVYPTARTVARFEFGDTMIRHNSMAPPCWTDVCTSHNFSTRIGGGVRF
jgi:outer membrane protein with beta-barrel domain